MRAIPEEYNLGRSTQYSGHQQILCSPYEWPGSRVDLREATTCLRTNFDIASLLLVIKAGSELYPDNETSMVKRMYSGLAYCPQEAARDKRIPVQLGSL